MRIEAKDLQSALIEASGQLECSVMDLEYQILQQHRSGFLGFGRKNAIIECHKKVKKKPLQKEAKAFYKNEEKEAPQFKKEEHKIKEESNQNTPPAPTPRQKYIVKNEAIFDSFHREDLEDKNSDDTVLEIKIQLEKLLKNSHFNIALIDIKMQDKTCIFIHLDGEDAALMIGKEAHRYRALSYLLHHWINLKYNLFVRLEIAQFLEKQTQAMRLYLEGVIARVEQNGRGQTKPLDGVLIKIALEELRAKFPHKYVGIKQNNDQKFVIVNDFFEKRWTRP